MSAGYIYVLTNPVMPGLVKIGMSGRDDLLLRLKELSGASGVPVAFECVYAKYVEDCRVVERAFHAGYDHTRVNPKREFFRIDPEAVISLLRIFPGTELELDVNSGTSDPEEIQALENERRQKFNFEMVNLVPGDVLEWVRDPAVTCSVYDERRVIYREKVMSLSEAAKLQNIEDGRSGYSVSGPKMWRRGGQTLDSMRLKKDLV